MKKAFFLFLLSLQFIGYAQEILPLGGWGNYLPYNNVVDLVVQEEQVVVACESGLFYYDRDLRSVEIKSKIDGLSAVRITAMSEHPPSGQIVIAYDNQIIDILDNGILTSFFDIQRYNIIGDKSINHILSVDQRMFLSCAFGIVEFDIERQEFDGPYFIGDNGSQVGINEMTFDGVNLWAATDEGVCFADINSPNLRDFTSWTKDPILTGPINTLTYFNNSVFVNQQSEINNNDIVYYQSGSGWIPFTEMGTWTRNRLTSNGNEIMQSTYFSMVSYDTDLNMVANLTQADLAYPLDVTAAIKGNPNNQEYFVGTSGAGLVRHWNGFLAPNYVPEGPQSSRVFNMIARDKDLWVAAGGVTGSFNNLFNRNAMQIQRENLWIPSTPSDQDSAFDIVELRFDPIQKDIVWGASYARGLLRWNANGDLQNIDDYTNSILLEKVGQAGFTLIGGIDFDSQGRIWMTNSSTDKPLVVRTRNSEWFSYSLAGFAPSSLPIKSILVDNSDQLWVQLRNDGIVVYNHNNSLANDQDDQITQLTTAIGKGALSSNTVLSMAKDKNGAVWVGTNQGVVTFFTPSRIFSGQNYDAQHILVQEDGYVARLLENESVTSIAIDGANRKWFGTARSGVFLMSEDGREELLHFTEENSPLFSNNIQDIAINPDNGEVYFGTQKGIISYRGGALEGAQTFENVYAYPNPVRPEYKGEIGIRGLVENASVKITDVSGNIVFETTALGGQAIWDGKSFSGQEVATGVYLVFLTNDDGSETAVTKIMIVR